jgi:hypothetical protein
MKPKLNKLVIALILMLWLFQPSIAKAATAPTTLAKAVEEIEFLAQMRSLLASSLKDQKEEPTLQTFKEVCQPVGMKAKQLSEEQGWQIKQIAKKYRNPAHKPDNLHSQMALAFFEQNPEITGFWDRETIDGKQGTRYYRRINVEATCLGCHGSKNTRPQFIQEKYPQDLAYDFKEGDLRGMYAVFIPDIKAALAQTTPN